MSKLYKTKGEMFNIIEQRFINFLKVNNIIIPDEYIQYDNDLKKSYDDIDMNVKRKALRYIQALCRLV